MVKDPVCGMAVDEKSGLKLTLEGKTYFFCSPHCLDRFRRENKIITAQVPVCEISYHGPFYKNKTFIVSVILLGLVLLSYRFPILLAFRKALFAYFKTIWWAVLLGLFLGGLIEHYIPPQYISFVLAQGRKRTIFYSVILGFLMSACSHGILALSIQLHKKGAANPGVVAFLLASPWANMTLTVVLFGFFGIKAFFIIISALLIAMNTGFIFQFLEKKNLIEKNQNTVLLDKDFSLKEDVKRRLSKYSFSAKNLRQDIKGIFEGMVSLSNMVLWWILIGIGLASLAGAYIPSHIFHSYLGPSLIGLLATLILATIIEVCSEGSSPLAFEIFRQTGALGNSFVFLMAGVVTDYTEIGLLWHNVGRRVALWLPMVTVPQVIILGIIANIIF
jgi:uncharacterized membrane protein YraQ (UPF0718 family)/YHS domain-containing protein